MSLLNDIKKDAIDSKSDISELLRRCKVLAYRLDNDEFKLWIEYELNGYPEEVDVPKYRQIHVESYGNFAGTFGSRIENSPIALSALESNHRAYFSKHNCGESVSSISSVIRKTSDLNLRGSWPHDLILYYGDKLSSNYHLVEAWQAIPVSSLITILDTVKNRILTFVLELEKESPNIGEDATIPIDKDKIQQNFRTIIMGNVTNLVSSGSQSVTYNTSIKIIQNDFDSLKRFLLSNELTESDIKELEKAIRDDGDANKEKIQGDKVQSWFMSMLQKAKSGLWQITVPVASQLLTEALKRYYGL